MALFFIYNRLQLKLMRRRNMLCINLLWIITANNLTLDVITIICDNTKESLAIQITMLRIIKSL